MAGTQRLICQSHELVDGGPGIRFDVPELGPEVTGFAIRFNSRVYAYINSCPHVAIELDWNHGDFFDLTRQYLVCSTHGALFQPHTGHCIAGPCRGRGLKPMEVTEQSQHILINLESQTNV